MREGCESSVPWKSQRNSQSFSQGAGLRSAWLFDFFCMQLLCIFFEACLCPSISLRALISLLQVITFSSKLRPGQSSIKLRKLMLSRPWRDSSSGCLCIFLNLRRQQSCTGTSGTIWLTALPWSTSQVVEREGVKDYPDSKEMLS